MTRLDDLVRGENGRVDTLAAFLAAGELEPHYSPRFAATGYSEAKPAYFLDWKGTTSGYQVTKTTFLAAGGKVVD